MEVESCPIVMEVRWPYLRGACPLPLIARGTVVDRGPRGSGSLAVSLDALK